MHLEHFADRLRHPRGEVGAGVRGAVETRDVHVPEIHRRLAAGDPLRHHPARAGRGHHAGRVEAGRDVETIQEGRLAQQRTGVRGEALRPVHEVLDPRLLQGGDAFKAGMHERLELLPVLRELQEGAVPVRPQRVPELGLQLEAAEHQLARVRLEVDPAVEVAHDRERVGEIVERLGHHVHVLHRLERHRHPGHRSDCAGPDARAIDDDLAPDGGPVAQPDRADRAVAALDAGAGGAFSDANAPRPRSFRVGHADIDRVRLTVLRDPQRPGEIIDPQVRGRRRDLVRFHHARVEAGHLSDGCDPPELNEPYRGAREPEPAGLPVAGALAGLAFERGEQLVRMDGEAGRVHGRAERSDDARGVPRGPAGEPVAFEQQHVVEAELGEMVGNAEPDHAAAADHDAGGLLAGHQCARLACPRRCR